jgi:MYXO-CTERM domain-containing protein
LKHLLFTALSSALLLHSTAALACSYDERCDVQVTRGEIPCVTISADADGCNIVATLTCPRRDAPALTLDSGQTLVFEQLTEQYISGGYVPPETPTTRTITWSRGEEQGEVALLLTDIPYEENPCDGCYCATSSRTPAAPLGALLPLLLGALTWRRARKN